MAMMLAGPISFPMNNLPGTRTSNVSCQTAHYTYTVAPHVIFQAATAPQTVNPSQADCMIPTSSQQQPDNGIQHQQTFTIFGKLPIEIRQDIWALARAQNQIVKVQKTYDGGLFNEENTKTIGTYKVPIIPQVNRDSRLAAMGVYKEALPQQLDKPVWFNFDEDILFFKNCSAINSFFLSSVPGSIPIQRSQIQLVFDYDMTDAFTKVRFLMLGATRSGAAGASLLVLCHQNLEKMYFERSRAPIANVHNYNQEVLVLRTSYEHFIQTLRTTRRLDICE
jgi:hypothetical protein